MFRLGESPAVRVGLEGGDLVMGAGRAGRGHNDVKTAHLNLTDGLAMDAEDGEERVNDQRSEAEENRGLRRLLRTPYLLGNRRREGASRFKRVADRPCRVPLRIDKELDKVPT